MDTRRNAAPADTDRLLTRRTEVEEAILKRRSVRVFKKKQVPEFMIKRVLEAGRFAPSAGNCQPWKFVVVRDPDLIQGLTETTIKICRIFSWLIDYRWTKSTWRRLNAMVNIRLKPNDLHPVPFSAVSLIANRRLSLYHGAPTVILIFKDIRGVSSPDMDCGIAGQNMVLAAHSMGLGTCWVGFTKLAFQYGRKWKKTFGIDYPYKFASSLSIGWPVGNPDRMVERPTHTVDWYENGARRHVD